jgi:hypothetical protein
MKARTLFVMSATIALLASCSVEQTETPNISQEKGEKTYLEVTATQPETSETRMTYTTDGREPAGMISTWSANEKLAVVSYSGEGTVIPNVLSEYLTGGDEAASSTTFAGTIESASSGDKAGQYNFYYPVADGTIGKIDNTAKTVTYDYTSQSNTLNSGVASPNVMSNLDVLYTEQAANPASTSGITLKRASSILRFILKLPQGTPPIQSIELSATNAVFYEKLSLLFDNSDAPGTVKAKPQNPAVRTLRLAITGDAGTAARAIAAYLIIPGGITIPQGTDITVSAITGDGAAYSHPFGSHFATADYTFNAGMTYSFAPTETLRLESVGDLSASATANSYMIGTTGGRYSFDATVRGNSRSISTSFSIAINKNANHTASVLWSMGGSSQAKGDGVVTGVAYYPSTGRIFFTGVNSNKGGNAVIVLKDGAGEVLWSWHIWMIASPKADQTYTTAYYGNRIQMMPYNLGAVNTTNAAATNAYDDGLLYQWGRKDPFLGGVGYSSNTNPTKGTHFYGVADFVYDGDGPVSIEAAYQNPTTFYANGSTPYDWCDYPYDNRWGNGAGSSTYIDYDGSNNKAFGVKTLFDPCPPGYKVAPRNTWNSGTFGSFSGNGRTYKFGSNPTTSFYPASGYRWHSDGDLGSAGSSGYYWSSSLGQDGDAFGGNMSFNKSNSYPLDRNRRANAFPVRCAREE